MATITQLEPGMLLRDVVAHSLDGREVHASDFRGRRNLVLIFSGQEREELGLLSELRQSSASLQEEEAVVLIADAGHETRRRYGAITPDGLGTAAVYVTDRYGEIFYAAHTPPGRALPGAVEVLDWLRFINAQCPE